VVRGQTEFQVNLKLGLTHAPLTPILPLRNPRQGGTCAQFAAVPSPRHSFHDRTQGRPPKAALTIATMPAFRASGRSGQTVATMPGLRS